MILLQNTKDVPQAELLESTVDAISDAHESIPFVTEVKQKEAPDHVKIASDQPYTDVITNVHESIQVVNEAEQNVARDHVKVKTDLPYALDNEEFLQLVPRTYGDADLFEWQPPAPLPLNPDEPGYMGTIQLSFFF